MARLSSLVLLPLLALSLGPACSEEHDDDHGHDHDHSQYLSYCELPAACQAIVRACHVKDDGSNAEIHTCHETAHGEGTDSACAAVQADCVAKCDAAPALPEDDAGMMGMFQCDGG